MAPERPASAGRSSFCGGDSGREPRTAPVAIELLVGAPNADTVEDWRTAFSDLPHLLIDDAVTERAGQVVEVLATERGGRHRGIPAADLLIAACAERAGVPLLHADEHFVRIAGVTGQPHWMLPA